MQKKTTTNEIVFKRTLKTLHLPTFSSRQSQRSASCRRSNLLLTSSTWENKQQQNTVTFESGVVCNHGFKLTDCVFMCVKAPSVCSTKTLKKCITWNCQIMTIQFGMQLLYPDWYKDTVYVLWDPLNPVIVVICRPSTVSLPVEKAHTSSYLQIKKCILQFIKGLLLDFSGWVCSFRKAIQKTVSSA